MVCCFFLCVCVCVPKIDATHKLNSILCIQCFRAGEIDYKCTNWKNNIIVKLLWQLFILFALQIATLNVSSVHAPFIGQILKWKFWGFPSSIFQCCTQSGWNDQKNNKAAPTLLPKHFWFNFLFSLSLQTANDINGIYSTFQQFTLYHPKIAKQMN